MSIITHNLQAVHDRIASAAHAAQRDPRDITLLAVSKTFGPDAVLESIRAGQYAFGENYLQEALDKIAIVRAAAPDIALQWHFIGPIQSNKTRPIAEHFDWVHTVGREKIAQRLSEQRPPEMAALNICVQVNISGETSKSGVAPQEVIALAKIVARMPRLTLRGLMAIPEPTENIAQQRAACGQLRLLFEQCRAQGLALDTLSMGMSSDLDAAIAEGATMVRIGSAIFGKR